MLSEQRCRRREWKKVNNRVRRKRQKDLWLDNWLRPGDLKNRWITDRAWPSSVIRETRSPEDRDVNHRSERGFAWISAPKFFASFQCQGKHGNWPFFFFRSFSPLSFTVLGQMETVPGRIRRFSNFKWFNDPTGSQCKNMEDIEAGSCQLQHSPVNKWSVLLQILKKLRL